MPPSRKTPELMAPAGEPEAGYAALHYGADAVYLGLKNFSARAEAVNFTLPELSEITAYAHQLQPSRKVYVTLNTVILQRELPEIVLTLAELEELGVDAIIVQDLGVARLARRHFPRLLLHASTQLAVHNLAGALQARQLGFSRVTLARELTLDEIRVIASSSGVEIETFIHGALCYSYSGICLYSSLLRGRSGNRGKCTSACRDLFLPADRETHPRGDQADPGEETGSFPFSMKDLALPRHLTPLAAAGVASFKIEGRKKNPLYVGAVVNYYRKLLDGQLSPAAAQELAEEIQTVFSRAWTTLFLDAPRTPDLVDPSTVGHQGAPIGKVAGTRQGPRGITFLRFRTGRPLEKRDGLQVALPGPEGKPFGFSVNGLALLDGPRGNKVRPCFEAPAGAWVEVELPSHTPAIPTGTQVFQSSSQQVKRQYRYERPKSGQFRIRHPFFLSLRISRDHLHAQAGFEKLAGTSPPLEITRPLPDTGETAGDLHRLETTISQALLKLGDTRLTLDRLEVHNPEGWFVPVSHLNQLRREITAALEVLLLEHQEARTGKILEELLPPACPAASPSAVPPMPPTAIRWLLKLERLDYLSLFEDEDWKNLEEVSVDLEGQDPGALLAALEQASARPGRHRFRLAFPVVARGKQEQDLRNRIMALRAAGWRRWEISNLSGWSLLGLAPGVTPASAGIDLTADWPLYALNQETAKHLAELGISRLTLSPEDGQDNLRTLLERSSLPAALPVYQDTPLFLASSCLRRLSRHPCPGPARCPGETRPLRSGANEEILVLNRRCGTVVLSQKPYSLGGKLKTALSWPVVPLLRADFLYRPYTPEKVREIWRALRAGETVPGTYPGGFMRGL